jgi:radical SAM protein with 4Fe4S-binding SPASM domain
MRPYSLEKKSNLANLLNDIKSKKVTLSGKPPSYTMEVSRRCNYHCKICGYNEQWRKGINPANNPTVPLEKFKKLAEELFPTTYYTESTLLGDPFFTPYLKDMLAIYRRYGVYWRPTTNASLLTEEKVELINGIVDCLKCSFDSHIKETYEKIRLGGKFENVVKNLKYFSRFREHMEPKPWFRVGIILMQSNLDSFIDYIRFAFEELGVDDVEMMALNYAHSDMVDEFIFDKPDKVNNIIWKACKFCMDKGYRLRLGYSAFGTKSSKEVSKILAADPANQSNTLPADYMRYSEDVRNPNIFGDKQYFEDVIVWTNDMRSTKLNDTGVCEGLLRLFIKPEWTIEVCGSCATYVLGDLNQSSFDEIYNGPMAKKFRQFLYERYTVSKGCWLRPCRDCLCYEQEYSYQSNGPAGFVYNHFRFDQDLQRMKWDKVYPEFAEIELADENSKIFWRPEKDKAAITHLKSITFIAASSPRKIPIINLIKNINPQIAIKWDKPNKDIKRKCTTPKTPPPNRAKRKDCPEVKGGVYISASGDIRPCRYSTMSFGNINKQSLEDIYNSAEYARFRDLIANSELIPKDCLLCPRPWKKKPFSLKQWAKDNLPDPLLRVAYVLYRSRVISPPLKKAKYIITRVVNH